ncbi:MAG: glutathione S-transferase family protein [Kordiimonadaceae bacterium]|nr:glutathione S-transferase family protein [Kordiimonadaceae bacterium]MBO6570235.1 glutathione S-transferase family protein [Kordiimonadaceae bacterium]MBO6965667.1 glutathione S-transferase family protein [Kordiimonadaceae bacterium]
MKIYGEEISGNCLKVKYVADYLGLSYEWIDVDIVAGGSRTPEMLSKNPAGQVPFVEFDDGRILSQSNTIIQFLAEESDLIPEDPFLRAKMMEWMFWEQYSHETAIAVARFRVIYQGQAVEDLDPQLVAKGNAALDLMEKHLINQEWFVGERLSLADVALVAYTQFAEQPGFSLEARPNVRAWVPRVKAALNCA